LGQKYQKTNLSGTMSALLEVLRYKFGPQSPYIFVTSVIMLEFRPTDLPFMWHGIRMITCYPLSRPAPALAKPPRLRRCTSPEIAGRIPRRCPVNRDVGGPHPLASSGACQQQSRFQVRVVERTCHFCWRVKFKFPDQSRSPTARSPMRGCRAVT
jgi:hypothetical protein